MHSEDATEAIEVRVACPVGCHERKVDVDLAGHQRRYGGGLGFSRAQHSMTAFFPVAMELEMR